MSPNSLVFVSALCLWVHTTVQAQSQPCSLNIFIYDSANNSSEASSPVYNKEGSIVLQPGQHLILRITSRGINTDNIISMSPIIQNSRSFTRTVEFSDIFQPGTYKQITIMRVLVGGETGWIDIGNNCLKENSTIFFVSDKTTSQQLVHNGTTIWMPSTWPRHIVPCMVTSKDVQPRLRRLDPEPKQFGRDAVVYDSKGFFTLLKAEDKIWKPNQTLECAVGNQVQTIEFLEAKIQRQDEPEIKMKVGSNDPMCTVRGDTQMRLEVFKCATLLDCHLTPQIPPYNPTWHRECSDCNIIQPIHEVLPTYRMRCFANGGVQEKDVILGLDRLKYFSQQVPAQASIQTREIIGKAFRRTFQCTVLSYLYLEMENVSIVYKNGSRIFLPRNRVNVKTEDGSYITEITIDVTEDMQTVEFHGFFVQTMKLKTVKIRITKKIPGSSVMDYWYVPTLICVAAAIIVLATCAHHKQSQKEQEFLGLTKAKQISADVISPIDGNDNLCCCVQGSLDVTVKRLNRRRNVVVRKTRERRLRRLTCREIIFYCSHPNHPNIIQLIGYYKEGGCLNTVMECSMSLEAFLQSKYPLFDAEANRQPERVIAAELDFVDILTHVIGVLQFLAEHGKAHGKLHPRNIFVTSNLAVKVGDFRHTKLLNLKTFSEDMRSCWQLLRLLFPGGSTEKSEWNVPAALGARRSTVQYLDLVWSEYIDSTTGYYRKYKRALIQLKSIKDGLLQDQVQVRLLVPALAPVPVPVPVDFQAPVEEERSLYATPAMSLADTPFETPVGSLVDAPRLGTVLPTPDQSIVHAPIES